MDYYSKLKKQQRRKQTIVNTFEVGAIGVGVGLGLAIRFGIFVGVLWLALKVLGVL